MSSELPEPTPDPYVADSWFQRPPFLATTALVVVLVGAALWFLGRESNSASETTLPPATRPGPTGPTPAPTDTPAPSPASDATTTPTTVLNPYGDVVGEILTSPTSSAALFAAAVQHAADPAPVAALHTPAYYYALWSRLAQRSADRDAAPVATPAGYAVRLAVGTVELVELRPRDGLVREGVEVRGGTATPFADGIQLTGVCQPDREPQCDLTGSNYAPDLDGSPGKMWALAKVVMDADTEAWILYVDLGGPRVVSASAEGSTEVGLDSTLNIVAVTYSRGPPPGTVLTLVAEGDDGALRSFDFAVA